MRRRALPLVLVWVVLAACSGSDGTPDASSASPTSTGPGPAASGDTGECRGTGTIERLDVRYDEIDGVDPHLLSLDLYLPELPDGCAPAAVVVYVHGGAFSLGDKRHNVDDKVALANGEGWAFASVNYRLSPRPPDPDDPDRVRYPDHNRDIAAALGWLHGHAEGIGVDAARIALMGHSAGAFLVALQATDPSFDEATGVAATDVACTIPLDTSTYDIRATEGNRRAEHVMYANAFGDDPEVRAAASPLLQAESGEGTGPFLIVTRRPEGRDRHAREFAAALAAAGVDAEVLNVPGYTHEEINDAVGRPGETVVTPTVTEFLRGCLTQER